MRSAPAAAAMVAEEVTTGERLRARLEITNAERSVGAGDVGTVTLGETTTKSTTLTRSSASGSAKWPTIAEVVPCQLVRGARTTRLRAVAVRSRSIKQLRTRLGRTLRDALEARQRKGGDGVLVFNAALVADPTGEMA